MRIALLDKDQFADLLKHGSLRIPDYSISLISEELPEKEALRLILKDGNPIEDPSQYIIVKDNEEGNTVNTISVRNVCELTATTDEGLLFFSRQFRKDLDIKAVAYPDIFDSYKKNDLEKTNIKKGIIAFRSLCGLDTGEDHSDAVDTIFKARGNRIKYRHHYDLPPEERTDPYSLMMSYDRYHPYPNDKLGYFCDVIETVCYYSNKSLGYEDSPAQKTEIYSHITEHRDDVPAKDIYSSLQSEKFYQTAKNIFTKPGDLMVPYVFFFLRDHFKSEESFFAHKKNIDKIQNTFPEAFDTASIYFGGFLGYGAFYEDYYTFLELPFIKRPELEKPAIKVGTPDTSTISVTTGGTGNLFPLDESTLYSLLCAAFETVGNTNARKNIYKKLEQRKNDSNWLQSIYDWLVRFDDNSKKQLKKLSSTHLEDASNYLKRTSAKA